MLIQQRGQDDGQGGLQDAVAHGGNAEGAWFFAGPIHPDAEDRVGVITALLHLLAKSQKAGNGAVGVVGNALTVHTGGAVVLPDPVPGVQ